MSATPATAPASSPNAVRTGPVPVAAAWTLLVGGIVFLAGGPLHPHEDPPGVSVKEHMEVMFRDPAWYPAHLVLTAGVALIAVALVGLVRSDLLPPRAGVRTALVMATVATCLAAPAALLHLIAAVDADRIAAHDHTPITDAQVVVETITTPFFGLAVAVLAVLGAATRTLGNWAGAVLAVLGGVGYALAGGTFLITDALDPLFPAAAGIALWAIITGVSLLMRRRRVE